MSRIFLTGGSGFLGRNLIRGLIAAGYEVTALARSPKARLIVEELGALAAHGDLDDVAAMREGMRGCDTIIHAAALAAEWGKATDFKRVNVQGTENVITAARNAGINSLVHISTEAVMADGGPMRDMDEQQPRPLKPLALYPQSKGLAEAAVLAANAEGLRTVVLRPRMIWGRDDSTLLPAFMDAVLQGRFMWMNQGRYLSSTTHVDNVVEGTLLALEKGRGGELYYLSDGAPVEFRSFITQLLATQGVTPPNKSIPYWLVQGLAQVCEVIWRLLPTQSPPPVTRFAVAVIGQEVTINDAKARRELGYSGRMSREAGLAEMKTRKT